MAFNLSIIIWDQHLRNCWVSIKGLFKIYFIISQFWIINNLKTAFLNGKAVAKWVSIIYLKAFEQKASDTANRSNVLLK